MTDTEVMLKNVWKRIVGLASCFALSAFIMHQHANGDPPTKPRSNPVIIDGERWTIVREDQKCVTRSWRAVEAYWESPRYEIWHEVFVERYLVNQSDDCWIEIIVEGADDLSYIFRVTSEGRVIDQRVLSSWGNTVYEYPKCNGTYKECTRH